MYYEWEWLSDLAIIPAFELFLCGILVGMIVTLIIVATGNKIGGKHPMRGIDISHYQEGLDIAKLAGSGLEFVILKITEGTSYQDAAAPHFYMSAKEAGIPVGGYCYSHALTADDARQEARYIIETLRGFPAPLGLYLDIEEQDQLALTAETLYAIVRAWCAEIRTAGYIPGVYGSEGTLWTKISANKLPVGCLVWVAKWGNSPNTPCDLWQYSDSGTVPGYDGPVDMDAVRSQTFANLVHCDSADTCPASEEHAQQEQSEGVPAAGTCPAFPSDPSVIVIQMVMAYNGYWGKPDGAKSSEFFAALRQFTDDMEKC